MSSFVLLSGGLDSSVLAYLLAREEPDLRAVYVDHGTMSAKAETHAATAVARNLGIDIKIIDISGFWPSFGNVTVGKIGGMTSSAIAPSAGILVAVNYAGWAGADTVYLGIHADDLAGRPWLKDLVAHYQEAVRCIQPSLTGSPPGGDEFRNFSIKLPFETRTKSEIITLGRTLGVDFGDTVSCPFAANGHCGVCYVCNARRSAFIAAGVADTTKYAG
ncbi:7-cyano-7-deazaguanine synthase [Paracoccus litorisediminis]|uniref:7-cyano-7-deazaguanine synthase n=1 Tax=Paracoccus litorisediminis TaxID=2006130 RepID=UPI00372D96A6